MKPKAKTESLQNREVSTSELAGIIGKTPQWISQLTRDGILEKVGRGKYILADAIQAYLKHIEGESSDGKISWRDEKAEHERIKKERAALELDELRGNLHTTDDIQEAWGGLLVEFRKIMLAMPARMASNLAFLSDENKIRKVMTDEISAALQTLAQYDPEKAAEENE